MERVAERVKGAGADVALASEPPDGVMLPVDLLRTDGDTQMRAGLDEATVQEYTDAMLNYGGWGEFPAVTAYRDGAYYWLCDGFHRVAAYKRAFGRSGPNPAPVPVKAKTGPRREAILHAAGANARHGLRRTNADKRRAVTALLKDEEWSQWSDREIARKCAVSDRLVNTIRADLEATANIRSQTERKGADGRTINVAPIKAAKVRYVPADDFEPPVDELPVRQVDAPAPSVVQSSAPASRAQLPALGKCAVCGRPLSDPEHAAAGCGPVCSAKRAAQVVEAETDANMGNLELWAICARLALQIGRFDLAPACMNQAQADVIAADYWSYPEDGLMRPWGGQVFLLAQGQYDDWADKILIERNEDRFETAIAVFPAVTGAGWFQKLMRECSAMCLFQNSGHAAFLFGGGHWRFCEKFSELGASLVRP